VTRSKATGPRLAAFVVTFRRPSLLAETVSSLLSQTRPPDRVLVVDNGASGPAPAEAVVRGLGDGRIVYHPMSENLGPAGAIAYALARLRDEGFDWILWGDDDDPPRTADTVERLCALLQAEEAPDLAGVAAVGVRWDWRRGEAQRLSDDELSGPREVDAGGGGQHLLVRSAVLTDSRLPTRELFFGLDDFDFCLRLRRDGYRFLVDGDLMLEYRRLAGRLELEGRPRAVGRARSAAPWRRYYTTRNYIYLMCRTFGRTDLALREATKALGRCAASWAGGPAHGWRFTRCQVAALRDGFLGRLGRTVEPSGDLRARR
jgi:glycosyltransferase involved in cell wall biosynthesis